jgi:uncharacterized protein (TIGR02147 family)
MVTIFSVSDYRDFLLHYYEMRKENNPAFSYRVMGDKLGIDASQLNRILHKKQHLPSRCVPLIKELTELKGRSSEYFDLIYAASKSKSSSKKQDLVQKASALKDVQRIELHQEQVQFLSEWWNVVVRAILEVTQGASDASYIARHLQPELSTAQVKKSLDLLLQLGLVERVSSERLKLTENHLTVGGAEKAQAVREFQKQVMQLGAESLWSVPLEERDISTLTLAVDQECTEDIKRMVKEFRRTIQRRVEDVAKPERIMQLNVSYFPVSKKIRNG